MKHNILLVDDDILIRESMSKLLQYEGFNVRAVASGDEGIALVRQDIVPFSLALVDYHMPGLMGPEVIKEIRNYSPNLTILGFSCDDSNKPHNESLDSGAMFFVTKDTSDEKLVGIVHRVCRDVERRVKPIAFSAPSENRKLIASLGMVGESAHTAVVAEQILKFGPTEQTVLIRGANGTGKELVARAIFNSSNRSRGTFVAVNVAAIAPNLIESELFGHEKGSFTGANQKRTGLIQSANGGTLFLDEIGELPMHLQSLLLRALQEKVITPVGSNEARKVDFRLIAATNAPLEKMIEGNKFREDLFYRLNVLPITLKSLCERTDDIPLLADHFFKRACSSPERDLILLESTVEEMKKLPWPGNVRQLENTIIRMVSMAEQKEVDPELLLKYYGKVDQNDDSGSSPFNDLSISKLNHEYLEKQLITEALLNAGGNVSAASRAMNIPRGTLKDKIKKFGIKITKGEENE